MDSQFSRKLSLIKQLRINKQICVFLNSLSVNGLWILNPKIKVYLGIKIKDQTFK